jgi:hypothetical protein
MSPGHRIGSDDRVVLAAAFDTRVVDKHVQAALTLDVRRRGVHRLVVGHVELHHSGTEFLGCALSAFGVAAANVDGVSGRDELTSRLEAQPLVGPCDQCCRHQASVGLIVARSQVPRLPVDQQTHPAYPRDVTSGNSLGEFLRARRDQLKPEEAEIPGGSRRRVPGLRHAQRVSPRRVLRRASRTLSIS